MLGLGSGLGLGLVLGSGLVSHFSGFTFCQIESDEFDKNRLNSCIDRYNLYYISLGLRLGLGVRVKF